MRRRRSFRRGRRMVRFSRRGRGRRRGRRGSMRLRLGYRM